MTLKVLRVKVEGCWHQLSLSLKNGRAGTSLFFLVLLLTLKAISWPLRNLGDTCSFLQLISCAVCSLPVMPCSETACLAYRCSAVFCVCVCVWSAHSVNFFERPARLPVRLNHIDCWHCQESVKILQGCQEPLLLSWRLVEKWPSVCEFKFLV